MPLVRCTSFPDLHRCFPLFVISFQTLHVMHPHMHMHIHAGWYVVIYYIILILFGSYFMVNMILAVLKNKFGKAQTMFETFTGAKGLAAHKKRRNTLIKMLANAQDSVAAFVMRRRQLGLAASVASSARSGASGAAGSGADVDPETPWYLLPLPDDANWWAWTRHKIAYIAHHKWFDWFFM